MASEASWSSWCKTGIVVQEQASTVERGWGTHNTQSWACSAGREKAEQTSCLPLPTATCWGVRGYMEVRVGLGQREREQTHPSWSKGISSWMLENRIPQGKLGFGARAQRGGGIILMVVN